jgi:phospholipid-transporting ATPase
MPQFWYGILSVFSGQTFYEQWLYQSYNLVFTGLPNIWYAIFDQEKPREELRSNPAIYYKGVGQENKLFDRRTFWRFNFYACFKALFIVYLVANSI